MVRAHEVAEERAAAAAQEPGEAAGDLLDVFDVDAAPLVDELVAGEVERRLRIDLVDLVRFDRGHAASHLLGFLGEHRAVAGLGVEQVVVGAHRDQPALVEQDRPLRERHRRGPVHDDEHGAALEDRAQRGLGGRLGVDVDRRQRVVEHEDPRPADDRPGQGEALPLSAGQGEALLADAGVEAPGEVEGEAGLGHLEGAQHLRLGGVGLAHEQVLAHRGREQRRLLEGEPDVATEAVDREVAEVVAVEGDAPGGGVVEAGQERDQRGLAGAGGPDDRDHLAGRHVEVDVGEDGALAALVGERHPFEADVAAGLLEGERARSILDRGHGVEHLVEAHRGALRLAGERHDPGQDLEREREHQHVGHERHQAAEAQAAGPDRQHAGEEHDAEGEVRDEGQHPHEPGVEAGCAPSGCRGSAAPRPGSGRTTRRRGRRP